VPSPKAASIRLELWGASKKSKLLADYTGVPVEIVAPGGAIFTHEDDGTPAD
jgi:hypothetical protein